MRMAACTDDNHSEIVERFRLFGWSVLQVFRLKNCCDIMVARKCKNFLVTVAIEIKDGKKPKSKRKLTTGEQEFKDTWRGYYEKVESLEDVEKVNRKYMSLAL